MYVSRARASILLLLILAGVAAVLWRGRQDGLPVASELAVEPGPIRPTEGGGQGSTAGTHGISNPIATRADLAPTRSSAAGAAPTPAWCTLHVVDGTGTPLPGARLFHGPPRGGRPGIAEADASGAIGLPRPPRDDRFLVVLPGYMPAEVEPSRGEHLLVLQPDSRLVVSLRDRATAAPIVGALVRRIAPPGWDADWLATALEQCSPAAVESDERGEARISTVFVDPESRWACHLHVQLPGGAIFIAPSACLPPWTVEEGFYGPLVLELEDPGEHRFRLRFVDGGGEAIAHREVHLSVHSEHELLRTTDDRGACEVSLQLDERAADPLGGFAVTVRLDEAQSWSGFVELDPDAGPSEEIVVVVTHEPIRGRVDHPDPAAFAVAAVARPRSARTVDGGALWAIARREELHWRDVPASGAFTLEGGGRGVRSTVVLLHRSSGLITGGGLVPEDGGEVLLEGPVLGEARAVVRPGSAPVPWRVELTPPPPWELEGGPVALAGNPELTDNRAAVELPTGTWGVHLFCRELVRELPDLELTGSGEVLTLDLAPLRRIEGLAAGSMRGPLVGMELLALLEDGSWGLARTDREGRFVIELPIPPEVALPAFHWGDHWPFEPEVTLVDRDEVVVHRREGCLRLDQDELSPMADRFPVVVKTSRDPDTAGYFSDAAYIPAGELVEVFVPPGEYVVQQGDGPGAFRAEVSVADGERVDLWVSSPEACLLEIYIGIAEGLVGELSLTLRREQEDSTRLSYEVGTGRGWDLDRLLLEPGRYRLEGSAWIGGTGEPRRQEVHRDFELTPGAVTECRIELE